MTINNDFYKVEQHGGTYITATFYNPDTKETKITRVRDYDYDDCSRDNDELYYMPIDEEVRTIWLHDNGKILVGDVVKVVKGRTIEHGYTGKVKDIKPYNDKYGRWLADYICFEDGRKINIDNCILVV